MPQENIKLKLSLEISENLQKSCMGHLKYRVKKSL